MHDMTVGAFSAQHLVRLEQGPEGRARRPVNREGAVGLQDPRTPEGAGRWKLNEVVQGPVPFL
jgi:hypothetical protein